MKIGVNTWIFDPLLPLENKVRLAREAGFEALELNFEEDYPNPILTWKTCQSDLDQIRQIIQEAGLAVSSVCSELHWKYSLSSKNKKESAKAIDLGKKMIDQAFALEAGSIVVIPGIVQAPAALRKNQIFESSDDVWKRARENLIRLAEASANSGVLIGIENVHFNKFLLSPLEMKLFIETINNPNVKVHLDIGNANINGVPEDWIITLNKSICAIHLKESVHDGSGLDVIRPFGTGCVDWISISRALCQIDYQSSLIIEQSYNKFVGTSMLSGLAANVRKIINQYGGG